jgi:hypothetical protein
MLEHITASEVRWMDSKRAVLSLAIILIMVPNVVEAATPPRTIEFGPLVDIDRRLDPGEWHTVNFTLLEGDSIYVDVTTGDITAEWGIDFFIVTGFSYEIWVRGGTPTTQYELMRNEVNVQTEFMVPRSGDWIVVFVSRDPSNQVHLRGYVGLLPPVVDLGLKVAAIASAIGVIAVVGIVFRRRRSISGMAGSPASFTQEEKRVSDVMENDTSSFCPYCGAAVKVAEAEFCSKCGRTLGG